MSSDHLSTTFAALADPARRAILTRLAAGEAPVTELVYKHSPEKGSEPVNFEVTVTFAAQGGKTQLTMRMLFPSAGARDHVVKKYGAIEGANQTLERLAEQLSKMAIGTNNAGL